MPRNRLRLTIYLGAALLAVGGGVGAAVAATNPAGAPAGGKLTATFSTDSRWDTGYQARYTIKNNTSAAVTGWQLTFGLPSTAKLGTSWDAAITTSGATSTAKDKGYNNTIPAGGTVEFGFIVAGKGDPTSCTINGAPCAGGGATPTTAPATKPPATPATKPTTTAPTTTAPTATKPPATTEPSKTTAPPPATGGGGNVKFAPYVDMGLSTSTGLAQIGNGVKSFSLAFVTSVGCKASWFNAFDPRTKHFSDEIDAVRRNGGDVKVSFGGATGIELAQACTNDKALEAEYQAVVSAYNLKYIDLDIEGAAVADKTTIDRRSAALASLQKANPGLKISLTLPVLPEGLTADGLNVVDSAKKAGVDVDLVNIMAMDYGRAGQDYGDLAIQAVKSTKDQIKSLYGNSDAAAFKMVGVTPMIGKNDDQGTFTQSDARDVVAFANANHLGFVSFWELNRDRNACSGALFQCTNIAQSPSEFSKIFAGFTG
ncbi:cellulose binding domain-containing protein [Krasilnikovia sp. MM14-A1004]|uniref:cellulose binding domain-containing protein n=1 Tax=Krasilnikovia sp. MM14-A1004 TaxID=3373541 RepID=UPI00399CA700